VHIGLDGHAMPAIRIGAALAGRGHEVIAWAPERYRARVEASGAALRPYDPFAGRAIFTADDFAEAVVEGTAETVERLCDELLEAGIDIVVHDTQALWGRVAGCFLGLPRIASFPLYPGFEMTAPPVSTISDESVRRVESSLRSLEHRWGVELGWWQTALVTDGDVTVCTSTSLFTGKDELPPRWEFVGPLMERIARTERDGSLPLVYVALGTLFSYRVDAFKTIIAALAGEPVEVFVAAGNAPLRDALESLPANVSVHGYIDSRELLARASVHVTHGGASSVHESLVAAVPMICIPQGSDHGGWADRIQAFGAGEVVPEDPDAIRAAVRRLLHDEEPTLRARELSDHFAAYDGADRLDRVVAGLLDTR
jgi:MGT family glycosyltransferase